MQNVEQSQHFKMYKQGKRWVTAFSTGNKAQKLVF